MRPHLPQKLWPGWFEDFPYSSALMVWSLVAGPLVVTDAVDPLAFSGQVTSENAWGAFLTLAGVAIALGLRARKRDLRPLAYALMGETASFVVFGLAAVQSSGWHRAGATVLLLFAIAVGCLGRSLQLLAKEAGAQRREAGEDRATAL